MDVFGVDLSPGTIDVARRDHPGVRFEVGSMTDPDLADGPLAGLVARYSLIHVPDDGIGPVLAHFRRVLRPGGRLPLGFHAGDGSRLRTEGYGGHPMKVHVHRRRPGRMAARLDAAGSTVEGTPDPHLGREPPRGHPPRAPGPLTGPGTGSARPTAADPRGRAPHGPVTRRYGPGPPARV
ncbi:class I SAM-dependent methyltransferase [Streptomyces thermolilacinus]